MVKREKCVFPKMTSVGRVKYKKKNTKKTKKIEEDRKKRETEWRKWWSWELLNTYILLHVKICI